MITYASFQCPTWDNPHLAHAWLEAQREELGEAMYTQEFGAQFVDDFGAVFQEEIGHLLPRVLVQAERYPELRASAAFLELQRELSRLETVIADRRELYNAATTQVNILRRAFPASLLARCVVPEALPLFQAPPEAPPEARAVPAVRF